MSRKYGLIVLVIVLGSVAVLVFRHHCGIKVPKSVHFRFHLSRLIGEEYPTCNKKEKGSLDLSHLAQKLLSEEHYRGKIEGIIDVTGRRGRSCKQLLMTRKERTMYRILKEEAEYYSLCRTRFGGGYGLAVLNDWNKLAQTVLNYL